MVLETLACLLAPAAGADEPSAGSVIAPIPLYLEHCARCHGEDGSGTGPHAAFLEPPPADLRAGRFKLKTTIPGTPPTIANVADTIRHGMTGTAMPAFAGILSDEQIEALAAYVFTINGRTPSRRSLRVASVPDLGAKSVVMGKRLYEQLRCADCHGEEGRGDGPRAAKLTREDGAPESITDLTRPWTFKGGWERLDIALRILAGMEGTSMPGYYDRSLRADQLYALVDYILSLRESADLAGAAARLGETDLGPGESLVARGRLLTATLACNRCHTPRFANGAPMDSLRLAGGMRIDVYPLRRVVASNLTPHATGIADLELDGFKQIMRTGRHPDGRAIDPLVMPWSHHAGLTDTDLEAIYSYLATLPPIANRIPATEPYSGFGPIVYKVRALLGDRPVRLVQHAGNAGDPAGTGAKPPPVRDRTWVRVAMILGGVLLFELLYFWRPFFMTGRLYRRRRHRPLRERVRVPVMFLSVAVAAGVIALVWWPPDEHRTPERTIELLAPPLPEAVGVTGDARLAAAHGRYLVHVAACGSCHTAVDPLWPLDKGPVLGGGPRVAWQVFGETFAPNLTPPAGSDAGGMSERELKRTLRSGLRPDGRAIHPVAMPWNQASRWNEEELHAVATYLRSLPPAEHAVQGFNPAGGDSLLTIVPAPQD